MLSSGRPTKQMNEQTRRHRNGETIAEILANPNGKPKVKISEVELMDDLKEIIYHAGNSIISYQAEAAMQLSHTHFDMLERSLRLQNPNYSRKKGVIKYTPDPNDISKKRLLEEKCQEYFKKDTPKDTGNPRNQTLPKSMGNGTTPGETVYTRY